MNYMDKFKNLAFRSGLKLSEVKKIAFERTAEFLKVPIDKVEQEPCTSFSQRVDLCTKELLYHLDTCRIVIRKESHGVSAKEVAKFAGIKFSSKVTSAALHKVFKAYDMKFDDFYSTYHGGLTFKILLNADEDGIFYATDSFDHYPCYFSSASYRCHFEILTNHCYDIIKRAVELNIINFNSDKEEWVMEYAYQNIKSSINKLETHYAKYYDFLDSYLNKAAYRFLCFSVATQRYCRENEIPYTEQHMDIKCKIGISDNKALEALIDSVIDEKFSSPTA